MTTLYDVYYYSNIFRLCGFKSIPIFDINNSEFNNAIVEMSILVLDILSKNNLANNKYANNMNHIDIISFLTDYSVDSSLYKIDIENRNKTSIQEFTICGSKYLYQEDNNTINNDIEYFSYGETINRLTKNNIDISNISFYDSMSIYTDLLIIDIKKNIYETSGYIESISESSNSVLVKDINDTVKLFSKCYNLSQLCDFSELLNTKYKELLNDKK